MGKEMYELETVDTHRYMLSVCKSWRVCNTLLMELGIKV